MHFFQQTYRNVRCRQMLHVFHLELRHLQQVVGSEVVYFAENKSLQHAQVLKKVTEIRAAVLVTCCHNMSCYINN